MNQQESGTEQLTTEAQNLRDTYTMNTITGYKIKTRTKTIGTTVTSTAESESRDTDKHEWLKAIV